MNRDAAAVAARVAMLQHEPDYDDTLMSLNAWLAEQLARRRRQGERPQQTYAAVKEDRE